MIFFLRWFGGKNTFLSNVYATVINEAYLKDAILAFVTDIPLFPVRATNKTMIFEDPTGLCFPTQLQSSD